MFCSIILYFSLLNVNEPLQIGGMSSKPPSYIGMITGNFDGCVRNVKENENMYDLKAVSNSKGSQEGCPAIDKHCDQSSRCSQDAKCVPSRKDFSCVCPPGYEGKFCHGKEHVHKHNMISLSKSAPSFSSISIGKTPL